MSDVVHAIRRRSWWDGSVTSWCGQKFDPREIREHWLAGGITCPACKAAARKSGKR